MAIIRGIIYRIPVFIFQNYKVKICLSHTKKPVWGNLDILKACGALDSGSNPGAGAFINVQVPVIHKQESDTGIYILSIQIL